MVFPNAKAPCRELAFQPLQLLGVPTVMGRGHQIINKTQYKVSPLVLSISLQLQENLCACLHVLGVLSKGARYFLLKCFCN